jgi:ketosteroid isomerase-like protein
MDLSELEARLIQTEDVEAIKRLKASYCEICDDDHNTDRIIGIFTEDGVWEGRGVGKASGHAELQALFKTFQASISFSQHMVFNPQITVDGDIAKGTWYFLGMFTFYEGTQAKWQTCRYHEDYRKVDGEWKIAHLRIKGPAISADYKAGWARDKPRKAV